MLAIPAAFIFLWCGGIALRLAPLTMAIIAVLQAVKSSLPREQKPLRAMLACFTPILGRILWWTVGAKFPRQ